MTRPHGTADFFALEAGECLDRLERAITHDDGPSADDMLRAARALRGSALMANHAPIARAAAGFEGLARAVRDRGRVWDAEVRERSAAGVDDLRHLVRRAAEWTDADTTRAGRLAADLDALAGSSSGEILRPGGPPAPGTANTGVRAFVAREGALIASALDRAARALESAPESREPLYAVLRRMQSLRGLAEISDLPPLPEILDGIELAVGDLTRLFAPPPGVSGVLDAAAAALTRISRDVTEHGRPQGDPPEARAFTEGLLRSFAAESDVVPVESLYRDGDPEPMQRSTAQPQFAPPAPLGVVEIVSYGEHLAQAADRIMSAGQGTARDLRLYTLVGTFRSVAVPGSDPVTPALARLGRAARMAIGNGSAAAEPAGFAAALRDAGAQLRRLAEGVSHAEIARELDAIARRLGLTEDAAPAAVPPPAPSEAPAPGIPEAAPELEAIPIEALAYDGESVFAVTAAAVPEDAALAPAGHSVPDVLPIESLAPSGRLGLERAYDRYRELVHAPPSAEAVRPRLDEDVVDITTLCYSGRRALERAAEVQAEIARRAGAAGTLGDVEPLVRELLDLVPLALAG